MSVRSIGIVAIVIGAAAGAWLMISEQSVNPAAPAAALAPRGDEAEVRERASSSSAQQPESHIRPRRLAEAAESEQPPLPVTSELVVTVVDSERQPLAGAVVTLVDRSWFGGVWRQTKADGVARIGLTAESTHLVVTAPGYPPVLAPITDRSSMRVVLGGEVTLRGKVVVDGSVPTSPLRLAVRGYDDPTDAWHEELRTIARGNGFGEGRILVDTDAKGEFAARGPARGSTVTIGIPAGYVFADSASEPERREKTVTADGEPVFLYLVATNAITGRVTGFVFDAAKAPDHMLSVGSPEVDIRYVLDQPPTPVTGSLRAKIGERFAIPFHGSPLEGVDIQVWRIFGEGKLAERKLRERIAGSKDVGDIAIEPPPPVIFRILDAAGAPIEKARVFADGHVSDPSDAVGGTKLGILPGTRQVIAGAPGFAIATFGLPEKLPETMDLRLQPSVTLAVRVRHEDADVSFAGRVTVSFDVDESILPTTGNSAFDDVRGTAGGGSLGNGNHRSRTYGVVSREDIVVSGFRAGDQIEVRVEDPYTHGVMQESITLPADGTHAIEMVVKSQPRTIMGTVLDHLGRPLAGARVTLGPQTWIAWAPRTDASGSFRFEDVYTDRPSWFVQAAGYVERSGSVDKPNDPLDIRLERARQVSVTMTGPQADPFEGSLLFVPEGGGAHYANRRGGNLYWFEAVPCRPGNLLAIGSDDHRSSIPLGADDTKISMPRPD